jgi:uncharacterized protein (TIGR02679 family)
LEQLLELAREKIREQDGVRGTVVVALGRSEQEELANLLGRPLGRSDKVRVPLPELDEALRRSRFQVGLGAVLEAGHGRLVTRRQEREEAEARWQDWLSHLEQGLPDQPDVRNWFSGIETGTSPSGRWCRRTYREDPVAATRAAQSVGTALGSLPVQSGRYELLAVFAARLIGDPHAFDAGQPAGALLMHTLAEHFEPPDAGLRPSEARALLLDRAGLGVDQVSSTVLVSNLAGAVCGGLPHPVVAVMAEYGGAWPLILGEVRGWEEATACHGQAYLVENPPVFAHLLESVAKLPPQERPTLICTGGFLSAAAVRLLDLLAASGTAMRYGGDFDRNGLSIAGWLTDRYGAHLHLWRMGPVDYRMAAQGGGKPLSEEECEALQAVSGPLAQTAQAVLRGGLSAYQERLVDQLSADLLK